MALTALTALVLSLPLKAANSTNTLAIEGITVLLSEDAGAYSEFAQNLINSLALPGNSKTSVKIIPLASFKIEDLSRSANGQLLIAVGTPAMHALQQKPPAMSVLNVLVPRTSYNKAIKQTAKPLDPHRFSAIYVDQSWNRQMALIRAAMQKIQPRVGMLIGKESTEFIPGLQAAAKETELSLQFETINEDADLLPALRKLLVSSDAIMAIPDPVIYNRNNIPSILLTSYRQQIPLFGFSASYVKAGALAAVYSLPAQIAQQVAEIIQTMPSSGYLPLPQHPKYFSVNVNAQVQHSLGLAMDSEAELVKKIKHISERGQ
ncbi:ABC transporter substrate-binding protein [Undibacterium sp. SXout7W]|uniref:ABC transporter substrate-binding protein n=1 Tax=Undibacterium sp. SXout7W TaxID=3413049 RepID=UPI003BF31689